MNRALLFFAVLATPFSPAFAQDIALMDECPDVYSTRSVQSNVPCEDDGVLYNVTYLRTFCLPAPTMTLPGDPLECTCGVPVVTGTDQLCIPFLSIEDPEWQGPLGPDEWPDGVCF